MKQQLTLNEANAIIVGLQKEIEYLEPLVDATIRRDLEINIDPAPASLLDVLNKELVKRRKKLDKLTAFIDHNQRNTRLEFDDGEADV